MRSPLVRTSALLLPLLLVGAVACSGSDGGKDSAKDKGKADSTTSIATSTTEPQPLEADQVDAAASPYCGVWAKIRKAGGPKLTGDSTKDVQIMKDHYRSVVPLAEELVKAAPKEVVQAAQGALAQIQEAARTGSQNAFAGHGGDQVPKQLTAYAADHCTKS